MIKLTIKDSEQGGNYGSDLLEVVVPAYLVNKLSAAIHQILAQSHLDREHEALIENAKEP
jgi:hypothetical protein